MRWSIVLVILAVASTARAETAAPPAPCDGCIVVPAAHPQRPLVVLIHGDEQTPTAMTDAFRDLARERDYTLFTPTCPPERGCDQQSFWRWNEEPSRLVKAMTDLAARHRSTHTWIVGWSGGAVYASFWIADLEKHVSAMALLGGASGTQGCGKRKLPVYLTAGDKNPYFKVLEYGRDRLQECKRAVTWRVLADKDHDDEWHLFASREFQRT
ncbi:MAG: alpha/beta hydrolase, partial [Kofleriaceae bacterium]